MSRKFLVGIDLTQNELSNAVIQNLASAPSAPADGQIYYNTSTDTLYFYNGNGWIPAGGTATGSLGARPSAASSNAGTFYYATDNYLLYYSNGSAWQQVDAFGSVTAQTSYGAASADGTSTNYARADHTHGTPSLGTSTPNAISGAAGSAGSASVPSKEDHTHAFTPAQDLSMAGYKLTNLGSPSADTDAANKGYVDSVAQGLDVKASVVYATAAALASYTFTTTGGGTLTANANGALSIDGNAVSAGQRILVKNETSTAAAYNGIYDVTNAGSAGTAWVLTRSADANTSAEVTEGMFTFVSQGNTLADTGWVLTTNNPITLNTTGLSFSQFSGAGTYTAGDGLTLAGNQFSFNPTSTGGLAAAVGGASIKLATNSGLGTDASGLAVGAGTGITVSTGTVAIDTSVVVRKYAANVGDGSATSYTITHNLGTRDVTVTVYDNSSPYAEVICDVQHATTNTITLLFSVAPTSNQYRVVVNG